MGMWKWIESWGGIFRGKILKENSGWFTDNVDDTQIMLTESSVKEIFPLIEQAYKNNKPFRFNIRGNLHATFKRLDGKQLVIRVSGILISKDYDPEKISSAKENYFEIYLNWESLPDDLKEFMKNKE
jgi:hypothetical protein